MVNIKDLEKKRKEKSERNHELYRGFFYEISEKIKNRDSLGNRNMIHRIPTIVIGFPMYDITHAIQYVISKLQTNGFFVCLWHDNYLYIDWSVLENNSKPHKKDKKQNNFSLDEINEKINRVKAK